MFILNFLIVSLTIACTGSATVQSSKPSPSLLRTPTGEIARGEEQVVIQPPRMVIPPDSALGRAAAPSGPIIISDVIGIESSINIFAGFTRDIQSISDRLADASQNTTVLAPLNSALTALPRKPWEDQRDYALVGASAYDGEEGEGRAHANLRRFVQAHLIPISPWKEGEKTHTIAGAVIWWENKEGKRVVSARRNTNPAYMRLTRSRRPDPTRWRRDYHCLE